MSTADDAMREILSSAVAVKEFVVSEAPEVVKQLLNWHATSCTMGAALGLAMCAVWLWGKRIRGNFVNEALNARKAYDNKEAWTRYGGSGDLTSFKFDRVTNAPVVLTGIYIALTLVGLVVFSENMYYFAEIFVAPKLYIVEYIAQLAK